MTIEERRAMIVRAALPLLVEIGPGVTTLQIARAAGISEPTIFRAFADKNEVLSACLAEAVKPESVVIELEAIDSEAGLEQRLTELIEVIRAQGERTGAIVNAISLAGASKPRDHGSLSEEELRRMNGNRMSSYESIHRAVCEVLKPDEQRLRLQLTETASLVLAIVMSLGRSGSWDAGHASVDTKRIAELLLHGIAN